MEPQPLRNLQLSEEIITFYKLRYRKLVISYLKVIGKQDFREGGDGFQLWFSEAFVLYLIAKKEYGYAQMGVSQSSGKRNG